MEEFKVVNKLGIIVDKLHPLKEWSIGICFSHLLDETYLYINLFFWTISIGKMSFTIFDNESK